MTVEASHRLLRWLLAHGADEFTISVMALADEPAPTADAFEDALAPFVLPIARRRVLGAAPATDLFREVRRWAFTVESLPALLRFLPGGLFEQEMGPAGWLEDLMVYRGEELVLGVVTPQREGVLRLTRAEHEQVEALRIPSSAAGEWVGY